MGAGLDYRTGYLAPDTVRAMFDAIAPVYDGMNRIMSVGLDKRWRRLAAQAAVRPGDAVLDACCGTGELALAALAAGGRVTGIDFSQPMLERAGRKSDRVEWVRGDVLDLPFPDASFDTVTVGFGVRNLDDLPRGLAELRRVLRRGGRLAVLEITRPRGPLALFYRVWFEGLVPLAGRLVRRRAAYTYLPASVRRFPGASDFAQLLRGAGFDPVAYRLLAGGIVALHLGEAR